MELLIKNILSELLTEEYKKNIITQEIETAFRRSSHRLIPVESKIARVLNAIQNRSNYEYKASGDTNPLSEIFTDNIIKERHYTDFINTNNKFNSESVYFYKSTNNKNLLDVFHLFRNTPFSEIYNGSFWDYINTLKSNDYVSQVIRSADSNFDVLINFFEGTARSIWLVDKSKKYDPIDISNQFAKLQFKKGENRLDFAEIVALNNIIALNKLDKALVENFVLTHKKDIIAAKFKSRLHNNSTTEELLHELELIFIEIGTLPKGLLGLFLDMTTQRSARKNKETQKINSFNQMLDKENILVDVIDEIENTIKHKTLKCLTGETNIKKWSYSFIDKTLVEKGKNNYDGFERVTTLRNGELVQHTKIP